MRYVLSVLLAFILCGALTACGGGSSLQDVPGQAGTAADTAAKRADAGNSAKPVSVPGAFPRSGGVPLYVHFFDDGSYDPDGQIVKWEWNLGKGGWQDYTPTEGDCWHLYDKPGTKVALLRVTDNEGRKDVGQVMVEMREGNNANPVAAVSAVPVIGDAPLTVDFSAAGSYDPDGTIVKHEWDWDGDGIYDYDAGTNETAQHVYSTGGLWSAMLRVTDDDAAQSTDSVTIDVNEVPVAVANADPTEGAAPLTVSFDADGSSDADGTIVKWEWDFGEGGGFEDFTPTAGDAAHDYTAAGDYTATLRVTDDDGAEDTDSVEIGVTVGRGDWWMFGRDSTHQRQSPFTGPQTNHLKWRFATGTSLIYSSPAIAADGTIYFGSTDWHIYAVNPDGSLKWKYKTDGRVYGSPAIGTDGTIYVGNLDDMHFYAINPDGSLKWRYLCGGRFSHNSGNPCLADDGTIYATNNDGHVYAFNPDGTLKWKHLAGGVLYTCPAIGADGTIYVSCSDWYLYALNPADGSLKWKYYAGARVIHSSPAVGPDGTIYFGDWYRYLHAVNPDGTRKWRSYCDYYIFSSPAIAADGTIYVGSIYHCLYAINPNGSRKWRKNFPDSVDGSPAIGADGTIYTSGRYPYLYAVNPDGSTKWSYRTGGTWVYSDPAIGSDGTLYIGGYDGYLYAFGD